TRLSFPLIACSVGESLDVRMLALTVPHAESSHESVRVAASATSGWQLFELLDVAAAKDNIVRLQRGDQSFNNICDMTAPALLAVAFQSGSSDVVFVCPFLVRKVAELHRFDNTVDDHGRAQPSTKTQKQQFAALIATQSLHGGVVEDLR